MMNRKFTPRNAVKLSREEAERQGKVTKLALETLGAQAAISFLNGTHDDLSGKPLEMAVASEDGFQAVVRLLATHAPVRT